MPGLGEVLAGLAADGWLLGVATNGRVAAQNAKIDHPVNDVLGATCFVMTAVWITREVGGHPWPEAEEPPMDRIESLFELRVLLAEAGAAAGDSRAGR